MADILYNVETIQLWSPQRIQRTPDSSFSTSEMPAIFGPDYSTRLLQLIIQMIGETEGISLIGLDEAPWPLLDMHDIDGDIQLQQVIDQCFVIVSCFLDQHEALFDSNEVHDAVDELAKSLTGIGEFENRTPFKSFMALQQRIGDKPSDMLGFPDVYPHVN